MPKQERAECRYCGRFYSLRGLPGHERVCWSTVRATEARSVFSVQSFLEKPCRACCLMIVGLIMVFFLWLFAEEILGFFWEALQRKLKKNFDGA